MPAYVEVQEREFALEDAGYTATRHQREVASEAAGYRATRHQAFVGTGYFDAVQTAITSGQFSTGAMQGSTEQAQFHVSRVS